MSVDFGSDRSERELATQNNVGAILFAESSVWSPVALLRANSRFLTFTNGFAYATGTTMRLEIKSAADFLVHLLRLQANKLSAEQLAQFKSSITEELGRRYRDHWFPDRPNRGSGYRCIRINGKMDPVIAQAGSNVGLLPAVLHRLFPSELTMWIDPSEVSYRIGENGSICVLYERKPEEPQPTFDSCKDSLIFEHAQFTEQQQMAAYVSS